MIPSIIKTFQERYEQSELECQIRLLLALLEVLNTIPTEFNASNFTPGHRAKLQQEILDAVSPVLSFLCTMLEHKNSEVQVCSLKALESWIQFGIPIDSLAPILNKAIVLARQPETFEACLQVLTDVVSHTSNARFEETLCKGLLPFIADLATPIEEAIAEENEDYVEVAARFVTSLTESFPTWFIKNLDQSFVLHGMLPLLLKIVSYPGYPGAEQSITEIPFQSFFLLQEALSDPSQVQELSGAHILSTNSSTDSLIVLDSHENRVASDSKIFTLPLPLQNAAKTIFLDLLAQLVFKSQWPEDQIWASWTKDKREKWGSFRRDCADTIQEVYFVLRDIFLEWILHEIKQVQPTDWKKLESLLFAVRSISESVPKDGRGATLIACVLSPELLGSWNASHLRVRQTMLYIVGSFAEWFHENPSHIEFGIFVLVQGIKDRSTVTSAAKALRDFCDVCRGEMGSALPSLISVYEGMKSSLPVRHYCFLVLNSMDYH
jgi:hypothetical protein